MDNVNNEKLILCHTEAYPETTQMIVGKDIEIVSVAKYAQDETLDLTGLYLDLPFTKHSVNTLMEKIV